MEPTVFCPDCQQQIPEGDFVGHRETQHPPAPIALTVSGIDTSEAFGYQPNDD